MGRSADDRWGERLLAELSSPDPSTRAVAARSCGEIEYKQSINSIIELVEDGNDAVSQAAIWALGQIGGQRSRRTIIDLLEEKKDPEEIEILEDALDHLVFADSAKEIFSLDLDTSENRKS